MGGDRFNPDTVEQMTKDMKAVFGTYFLESESREDMEISEGGALLRKAFTKHALCPSEVHLAEALHLAVNKMEYRDKTEVLGFLAYELLEKKADDDAKRELAEKERKDKLAAAVAIATAEGGSARSATPRKRPAAGEKTPQKRARGDGDGDDGDDNDFTENVRKSLAKLQRFLPADVLASAHRIVDSTRFKAYRDTSHAEPKQHFRVITIDDKKHRGLHTGFAHLLVEAGLDKTSAAPLLSADAKNLGIAGNSFLCDSRNAFVGKVKAALEEESHM